MHISSIPRDIINFAFHPLESVTQGYHHFASVIHESFIGSVAYSLKGLFISSKLAKEISAVAKGRIPLNDPHLIVSAFNSSEFPRMRRDIARIFNRMGDPTLDITLKALFNDQAAKEPELLIQRLNSLLTLQKMESLFHFKFPNSQGIAQDAFAVAGPAHRDLEVRSEESHHHFLRLAKHYAFTTFEWIMDTLLNVLMLTDITDGDATKMEKQLVKTMQFTALAVGVEVLASWAVGLAGLTGSILAAATIFSSLALVAVTYMVVYLKYIKPAPLHLHPGDNLTDLAIKKQLLEVTARQEIAAKIIKMWELNSQFGEPIKHPVLVGESGVGKSKILNEVAKQMSEHPLSKHPQFKHVQLHSFNANHLVDGQGDPEHWELVLKNTEGYENKTALFVDEVSGGFRETKIFGNLILTAMDKYPYMAFATTREEYKNTIKNSKNDEAHLEGETKKNKRHPFKRRGLKYDVQPLKDEQVQLCLAQALKKVKSDFQISNEVVERLSHLENYDEIFKGCPQPLTSKTLLYMAILEASQKKLDRKNELRQKKDERELLDLQWENLNCPASSSEIGRQIFEKLKVLDEEISSLTVKVLQEERDLNEFNSLRDKLSEVVLQYKKLSLEIKKGVEKKRTSESLLKEYVLLAEYCKPALEGELQSRVKTMKNVEITLADIEPHIQKEAARLKKKLYKPAAASS